jgi:hypothetical protein
LIIPNYLPIDASEKRTHSAANETGSQESGPHQTIRLSHKPNEKANKHASNYPTSTRGQWHEERELAANVSQLVLPVFHWSPRFLSA